MPLLPWKQGGALPFERLQIEIEGKQRRFAAWMWEGRVAFQDEENPRLCWATLETWDRMASRSEFWRTAIQTRRIGRYGKIRSGFKNPSFNRRTPQHASFVVGAFNMHVLADESGGGLVSLVDKPGWKSFEPYIPTRITHPSAWVPSIFSPGRHLKFVRPALWPLGDELMREQLSPYLWMLWEEGANYKPLQAVVIALHVAMGPNTFDNYVDVRQLWLTAYGNPQLLELVGFTPDKKIVGRFSRSRNNTRFHVQEENGFNLRLDLPVASYSAHDLMEAYIELGKWLRETVSHAEAQRLMNSILS